MLSRIYCAARGGPAQPIYAGASGHLEYQSTQPYPNRSLPLTGHDDLKARATSDPGRSSHTLSQRTARASPNLPGTLQRAQPQFGPPPADA